MSDRKGKESVYDLAGSPDAHQRYLEEWEAPTDASIAMLDSGPMAGKTLADLGAGPSTRLGTWVEMKDGVYIALDPDEAHLEKHHAAGFYAISGRIEALPAQVVGVSITHVRMVLMHLSSDVRELAIREAIRAAKERAIFIEIDWTPLGGSEPVDQFRDFSLAHFGSRVDFYCGKHLLEEVAALAEKNAVTCWQRRFPSKPGPFYKEPCNLARGALETARVMAAQGKFPGDRIGELERIIAALDAEARSERPAPFRPPDLVGVEVIK